MSIVFSCAVLRHKDSHKSTANENSHILFVLTNPAVCAMIHSCVILYIVQINSAKPPTEKCFAPRNQGDILCRKKIPNPHKNRRHERQLRRLSLRRRHERQLRRLNLRLRHERQLRRLSSRRRQKRQLRRLSLRPRHERQLRRLSPRPRHERQLRRLSPRRRHERQLRRLSPRLRQKRQLRRLSPHRRLSRNAHRNQSRKPNNIRKLPAQPSAKRLWRQAYPMLEKPQKNRITPQNLKTVKRRAARVRAAAQAPWRLRSKTKKFA